MEMSMRALCLAATVCLVSGSLAAQNPPPPGPGGFQPPPDHWMTMDSLATAVGLDAAQRTAVGDPYRALNGVMKQAADKRAALRKRFEGQPRPQMGQLTPEQQALRDSVRAEMDELQSEADMWYGAIRTKLRPDQQAKFDALPKPVVAFRRRSGGPS